MPSIGLGKAALAVEQAETDDYRTAKPIGFLNREFEGRIEVGAIGLLEQVEDVGAALTRLDVVQSLETRRLDCHAESKISIAVDGFAGGAAPRPR